MIDLYALLTDPGTGVALLIGSMATGIVAGAVTVALTLVYGRE